MITIVVLAGTASALLTCWLADRRPGGGLDRFLSAVGIEPDLDRDLPEPLLDLSKEGPTS